MSFNLNIDLSNGIALVEKENNSGYTLTMMHLALRESKKQDVILVSSFIDSSAKLSNISLESSPVALREKLLDGKHYLVIFEDDFMHDQDKVLIRNIMKEFTNCTFIVPNSVVESNSGKVIYNRLYSICRDGDKSLWSGVENSKVFEQVLPLDDFFNERREAMKSNNI